MANAIDILSEGTLLGKCRILGLLGQGGMGAVYKGFHEGLQTEVAIKVVHQASEECIQNFVREAQAIARLQHPNIMKIYDIEYDVNSHKYYIVAQLILGKTLDKVLKEKGTLPVMEAINIIAETSKGLAYAHQMGIIHRDIKPGNIMLDESDHVKITDFGIAYMMNVENQTQQKIMGTPNYIAPEQCLGYKLDGRTDMYALGGTFYHLLSGVPPFHGNYTASQLIQLHLNESPTPLERLAPHVPINLIKCIRKMMARDPQERYSSCDELSKVLEEIKLDFQKVKCPRCGQENSLEKVFDCPRCNTKNLCISHLIPHKQYCEFCEKMAQDTTSNHTTSDLKAWLEPIQHVSQQKEDSLMYILTQSSQSVCIFLPADFLPEQKQSVCQLQTKDINYEKLRSRYAIPPNIPIEKANITLMKQILLETIIYPPVGIKCYSLNRNIFLPPHPTAIHLTYNKTTFLKMFETATRIYKSFRGLGGIYLKSSNDNVSIIFHDTGIAIYQLIKNQEVFISNISQANTILMKLFHPSIFHIEYIDPIIFPPIPADIVYHPPQPEQIILFLQESNWEILSSFMPDISNFFQFDEEGNLIWDENKMSELRKKIESILDLQQWLTIPASSRFSPFEAIILLVAVLKEIMREVTENMMEFAKQHIAKETIIRDKIIASAKEHAKEASNKEPNPLKVNPPSTESGIDGTKKFIKNSPITSTITRKAIGEEVGITGTSKITQTKTLDRSGNASDEANKKTEEGNKKRESTRVYIPRDHSALLQNQKTVEQLLKSVELLSPDHPELLKMLTKHTLTPKSKEDAVRYYTRMGDIYYRRDNLNKAITYYQFAIDTGAYAEEAKLNLFNIYQRQENSSLALQLGLELFSSFQKKTDCDLSIFQHICQKLLEMDRGLVECRRELVNIHLKRNDVSSAIKEYRHLARFYEQMGDKTQFAECNRKITELDPSTIPIEPALNISKVVIPTKKIQNIWKHRTKYTVYLCIFVLICLLTLQAFQDWKRYYQLQLVRQQLYFEEWESAEQNLQYLSSCFYLYLPRAKQEIRDYLNEVSDMKQRSQERTMNKKNKHEKERILFQKVLQIYQEMKSFVEAKNICKQLEIITGDHFWKEQYTTLEYIHWEEKEKNKKQE